MVGKQELKALGIYTDRGIDKKTTPTKIYHEVRQELNISIKQYMLLDSIGKMSKENVWCYASRDYLASQLGISKSTTKRYITEFIRRGFISANESFELKLNVKLIGNDGFTIIKPRILKEQAISADAYYVLDVIYQNSFNRKSKSLIESINNIAIFTSLSPRNIDNIFSEMRKKGFLVTENNKISLTEKWIDIRFEDDENVQKNVKKVVKKHHERRKNEPQNGAKMNPKTAQKCTPIYKNNNKINNKEKIYKKVFSENYESMEERTHLQKEILKKFRGNNISEEVKESLVKSYCNIAVFLPISKPNPRDYINKSKDYQYKYDQVKYHNQMKRFFTNFEKYVSENLGKALHGKIEKPLPEKSDSQKLLENTIYFFVQSQKNREILRGKQPLPNNELDRQIIESEIRKHFKAYKQNFDEKTCICLGLGFFIISNGPASNKMTIEQYLYQLRYKFNDFYETGRLTYRDLPETMMNIIKNGIK